MSSDDKDYVVVGDTRIGKDGSTQKLGSSVWRAPDGQYHLNESKQSSDDKYKRP